ncbi:excisionase family DNA binding protein [Pedobacter cryoconitis]|uniref:Excisionase family DNA binding protein n=1 Tax=Pedobacter cryoconitis TaxID=188932 RepID=A0A7W8ZJ54_9SPHI|nr:helix-turn-helix domain-containing protein [Pedobacter cryoconitis]MBB5634962.1 excisionase family DNA binding protein [Pedobacter cryoconitis]
MSSNINIQRICEHCGKPFRAKTTVTRFCGTICNGRHAKQKIRDLKIKVSDKEVKENITSVINHPVLMEFLTIKQAAQLLGLCTKTLYNILQSGKIKAVRLSTRKTIIKRTEIDKVFEQSEFEAPIREKPKKNPHPRYCYTMAQAQDQFNCSEKALYDLIKRNNLSKFQDGWYTYVLKSDLHSIFNQNR